MKLSFSSFVFSVFGAATIMALLSSSTTVVEGTLSMRGNSKSATDLMKVARRVEDVNGGGYSYGYNVYGGNQYYGNQDGGDGGGGGEEQDLAFLTNYSIKLLSCVSGEVVRNYDNNNGEVVDTSAVIFRLCPRETCSVSDQNGCASGYGDYVIGMHTFLELYWQYAEEEDQQNQGERQLNNNNNNNYNNNGQYNGGQYNGGQYNGYNNGQYNSLVVYNQYGAEFDASEYLECSEYKNEEANEQQADNGGGNQQYNNYYSNYNNNNQYNNNQQQQQGGGQNGADMQYFIGPGCSADGTTIGLKLYLNEECTYPANSAAFSHLSYGAWPNGLPFANGGLVAMNCAQCYAQNENYEWELNELCQDAYEQTASRCEQGMTTTNTNYAAMNYNNNEQGQGQQNGGDQYANNYYYQQQQDQMQGGYYSSNNNGCDYIESLLSRKSLFYNNLTGTWNEALVTAVIVLLSVAVIVGVFLVYTKFSQFFTNKGEQKSHKVIAAGSVGSRSSDDDLLTDAERTQIS